MLYSEFLTHLANAYADFNNTHFSNSNAYLCYVLRNYNTQEERTIKDNFFKHSQLPLMHNELFDYRNTLENEIRDFQIEHGGFATAIVKFYEPSYEDVIDAKVSNKYRQRWLNDLAAIAQHEEQSDK